MRKIGKTPAEITIKVEDLYSMYYEPMFMAQISCSVYRFLNKRGDTVDFHDPNLGLDITVKPVKEETGD